MLVSKFAEDIREHLGDGLGELPRRGKEHHMLDELTSVEFDALSGAVTVLRQVRFVDVMSDPALPRLLADFNDDLNAQKAERAELRESVSS